MMGIERCKCAFCGIGFDKRTEDIRRTGNNFCSRQCCANFKSKKNTDEFYTRCEMTESCWIWTGNLNMHGYGYAMFKGKAWLAHRYSYFLNHGEIPKGMEIMHSCDNRKCINPAHLSVGSHKENMDDMITKGRHNHILNNQDKVLIAKSLESTKDLAKKYGVSERTIRNIRTKGVTHWMPLPAAPEQEV